MMMATADSNQEPCDSDTGSMVVVHAIQQVGSVVAQPRATFDERSARQCLLAFKSLFGALGSGLSSHCFVERQGPVLRRHDLAVTHKPRTVGAGWGSWYPAR